MVGVFRLRNKINNVSIGLRTLFCSKVDSTLTYYHIFFIEGKNIISVNYAQSKNEITSDFYSINRINKNLIKII